MTNNEQKFELLARLSAGPILLVNTRGKVIKSSRLDNRNLIDNSGSLAVDNKDLFKNRLSILSKNLNLMSLPLIINSTRYQAEGTRFNPNEQEALVVLYLKKKSSVEKTFNSLTKITDLSHKVRKHIALEKKLLIQAEELKQSEKKLKEAMKHLDASNKELKQFTYIASHDLQAPLNSIIGFSDLLDGKLQALDETGHDYLNRIKNASERMKNLIDDLLMYSRITRGKLTFEPVDLNEVSSEVLKNLETDIKLSKARITIEKLPIIQGIKSQCVQLFQNLISNAIKYVKNQTQPQINLCEKGVSGGMTYIEIADNGIGIEKKYFEQIFQPFKRLHSSTEYTGTGIGLSICKKIVEHHKGELTVTSQPGKGTQFTVSLPTDASQHPPHGI